jgi:hypothetical protein
LLCISDDFAGHDKPGRNFPITDYALSRGVTLRDDSILVQASATIVVSRRDGPGLLAEMPVILEHEHYAGSKGRGAWSGELLLKAVEDYHASFMSIHGWPREILTENRETIDKINQRMGYRLQPLEVSWPKTVEIGKASFKVNWTWANKGVAPCYPGGFPCLTLKDAEGGIVSVLTDESLDMRRLKVGPPDEAPVTTHESDFTIGGIGPTTKPGTLRTVYLSRPARRHAADRPASNWRRRPAPLPAGHDQPPSPRGNQHARKELIFAGNASN